jgi:hypothetical protein
MPPSRRAATKTRPVIMALVACLGGAGCMTLGDRGEALIPSRVVTQTGPYRIWTHGPIDADEPALRQLQDLERQLEGELALRVDPTRSPIDIYILRDRPAFEHFLQFYYPELPPRRAFFLARGDQRVVYTYQGPHIVEDLRHEASHALLHASVADLPLWLDEGLAEYFEVPGDRNGLNTEHLSRVATDIGEGWHPDLARLERLRDVRQMKPGDYRESWAWVHFLLNGPKPGRAVLLGYLADLRAAPDAAPLSERLGAAENDPGTRLVAYLENVRQRPLAAKPARTASPTVVIRGQDPGADPPRPSPRRRSLFGRFLGLFGLGSAGPGPNLTP